MHVEFFARYPGTVGNAADPGYASFRIRCHDGRRYNGNCNPDGSEPRSIGMSMEKGKPFRNLSAKRSAVIAPTLADTLKFWAKQNPEGSLWNSSTGDAPTRIDTGDVFGSLKALPVEQVHTAQEASAIAMLAALKLARRRLNGDFMLSTAMTVASVDAAISNAEAAGWKAEG